MAIRIPFTKVRIKIDLGRIGNEFEGFARADADKVVAALKATMIGDAAVDVVKALRDRDMTGKEKLEAAVREIAPLIVRYAAGGGVPALIGDVEDLTRQLIQSVYVDTQSTGFRKIVGALKELLGL